MENINFKFENRDIILIKGYNDAQDAFDVANKFLAEIDDEDCNYIVENQHEDFNEDGSIEFMVKCYDKK